MRYFRPEKVYIEEEALEDAFTHEILQRIPAVPREVIPHAEALVREFGQKPHAITQGKKNLLLKRKRGESLKPFPLIPEYLSCHSQILHLGSGCDLECTYCILQSYLNNPLITVYTNFREILGELETELESHPQDFFRIGTGELIDSLSLDHLTEWSVPLVRFFAARENAILEFKTKSDNIAHLRKADPKERVIVSWSMNSDEIQKKEEFKTATIAERLQAARQCQEWGYLLGFHFDPLIHTEGWEEGYARAVEALFEAVDASRIAWISLGALRFMPSLKKIAERRFPRTGIFTGEFVKGLDGKSRYFRPIRTEMYTKMRDWIRSYSSEVPIYLCMESSEVWECALEFDLATSLHLKGFLDHAARRVCRLA